MNERRGVTPLCSYVFFLLCWFLILRSEMASSDLWVIHQAKSRAMITAKRGFPITPVTFGGCCSSSLAGRGRKGCFPSSARSLSQGEGKMCQEHVEAVKRLFDAARQGNQPAVLEAHSS